MNHDTHSYGCARSCTCRLAVMATGEEGLFLFWFQHFKQNWRHFWYWYIYYNNPIKNQKICQRLSYLKRLCFLKTCPAFLQSCLCFPVITEAGELEERWCDDVLISYLVCLIERKLFVIFCSINVSLNHSVLPNRFAMIHFIYKLKLLHNRAVY